jgi:hypothetical protein
MTIDPVLAAAFGAAAAPSAGGAPAWQLAVLLGVYFGGTAGVLALIGAQRSGRTRAVERAGGMAARIFAVPGWSALPVACAVVGLLLAMWGGVWDIGYHIDNGRDRGPLGNPGHWPLLIGLFLTFASGLLSCGMADQADATPAWLRLGPGWRVPLGGVLLAGCMAFALLALGLDDVWHRIFGQDVTLWSPTHFVFLFGGVITVTGMLVLLKEGSIARQRRQAAFEAAVARLGAGATEPRRQSGYRSRWRATALRLWIRLQRAALLGGLLCGLELFLTEYDYGVPLYRQVWQPLLLAGFSGFVLTAARAWAGPGGALTAWVFYAVIRGSAILVPMIAGVSPSSMPLLLAAALCVELLALGVAPRRRALAFGAGAGLLCGTVGFAAEYAWSQVAMPLPWTAALLPEGLVVAALAGSAGGVLGALFAGALRGQPPEPRVARTACIAAFALLIGVCANAAIREAPDARARVELADVPSAGGREALATVRFEPRDAADGANWLYMLAWSGGEPRLVDRLVPTGEGAFRSTEPIPLSGSWKVALRLNRGYEQGAVPVRLPVDRGLPNAEQRLPATLSGEELLTAMKRSAGAELPAPAAFTRPLGPDGMIMLRETKGDVPGWLWTAAIALTGLLWGACIAGLTLGVARLGRRARPPLPGRTKVNPRRVTVPA